MEKKKSKGLFGGLFAPKQNSGCCNVQFEEIFGKTIDEKELTEKQGKDNSENKNEDNKDNPESEKGT